MFEHSSVMLENYNSINSLVVYRKLIWKLSTTEIQKHLKHDGYIDKRIQTIDTFIKLARLEYNFILQGDYSHNNVKEYHKKFKEIDNGEYSENVKYPSFMLNYLSLYYINTHLDNADSLDILHETIIMMKPLFETSTLFYTTSIEIINNFSDKVSMGQYMRLLVAIKSISKKENKPEIQRMIDTNDYLNRLTFFKTYTLLYIGIESCIDNPDKIKDFTLTKFQINYLNRQYKNTKIAGIKRQILELLLNNSPAIHMKDLDLFDYLVTHESSNSRILVKILDKISAFNQNIQWKFINDDILLKWIEDYDCDTLNILMAFSSKISVIKSLSYAIHNKTKFYFCGDVHSLLVPRCTLNQIQMWKKGRFNSETLKPLEDNIDVMGPSTGPENSKKIELAILFINKFDDVQYKEDVTILIHIEEFRSLVNIFCETDYPYELISTIMINSFINGFYFTKELQHHITNMMSDVIKTNLKQEHLKYLEKINFHRSFEDAIFLNHILITLSEILDDEVLEIKSLAEIGLKKWIVNLVKGIFNKRFAEIIDISIASSTGVLIGEIMN